jgi:hypothetical protein
MLDKMLSGGSFFSESKKPFGAHMPAFPLVKFFGVFALNRNDPILS